MKEYITPKMEVTEFYTEDVITTSGVIPDYNEGSGDGEGM